MRFRRSPREHLLDSRFGRARYLLSGFWDVGTWTFALMCVVVALSRVIGGNAPVLLQPLQAVLPVLFIPIWLVLFVAVVTRRWPQAIVAGLLALTHFFSVNPARVVVTKPFWLPNAPTLSVAHLNVFVDNKTPDATVDVLLKADADVLVLNEFTDSFSTRMLVKGAFEKYPYRALVPRQTPFGAAIFSKYPFDDVQRVGRAQLPSVRIVLPDGDLVRVVAVHPEAPLASGASSSWDQDLKTFGRLVADAGGDEPVALVGDFNGTRWQPPFGHLLAGSLRDAHETMGKGLTFSWPVNRGLVPFARLDHALHSDRLFPLSITELADAGSDHRGFVAKFAIRRLPAPPVIVTGSAKKPKGGKANETDTTDKPTKSNKAKKAKKAKKASSTAVATVAS
jgi:endonuclease/exonuclease/phosphatase (EEP) superfamily protein YafD